MADGWRAEPLRRAAAIRAALGASSSHRGGWATACMPLPPPPSPQPQGCESCRRCRGQAPYPDPNRTYTQLELSPLYVGLPDVQRVDYVHWPIRRTLNRTVGGYVEPFAFGRPPKT